MKTLLLKALNKLKIDSGSIEDMEKFFESYRMSIVNIPSSLYQRIGD